MNNPRDNLTNVLTPSPAKPEATPPVHLAAAAGNLEHHPLAEIFPEMNGSEFEGLKASIRANGLRQPIVLYEGKVLDGRADSETNAPSIPG